MILQQQIAEHGRLLKHVEAHEAAMKAFDLRAMDAAANQQEASRLRIATLENKRKTVVLQLSKLLKVDGTLTLAHIAELNPQRGEGLLRLRDELKAVIKKISDRTHIAGRLAGAVLGHLNTVVRLLAGAVEQGGVYTKHGVPQVSSRIGMMEAVG
jgi:hypothetical protein